MRQLPFMNGIKAFEAAARSGSFAKAADELHVTPAAVSRMVHLLEARLAVTLFERKANRLAPTPAGRAYQAGLTQLFDQLSALTDQVTAMGSARVLTVGVGPTFAIRWLIPRLADFQKARARHRCSICHRRRGAAVQRRLDLRHQARRRRLSRPDRGAAVQGGPDAGVHAGAGQAAEAPGGSQGRHAVARHPRGGRLAALVQGGRGLRRRSRAGRSSTTTATRSRRRPTASASRSACVPTSTTISRPGGW